LAVFYSGSGGGGGAGYVGGGGGGGGGGNSLAPDSQDGTSGGGGGAGSSYSAGSAPTLAPGNGHPRLVITYAKVAEHPELRLSSPTRGVLDVRVIANPRVQGLTVRIYRTANHVTQKIGTVRTNKYGIATFTNSEKPGATLGIRIDLAASAITRAATTSQTITIRG
jgi:hypothetical protein